MKVNRAESALKYLESAHVPSVILKIAPIQHLRHFRHVLMTPVPRIKMVSYEAGLVNVFVAALLLSSPAFSL